MFFHQLWSKELKDPSGKRMNQKPRTTGLTIMLDQGIGLDAFTDLLQLHASYIDFIKLGAGTATLYPPSILKKKSEAAKLCQVELLVDSSLLTIAYIKNQLPIFYKSLQQLEIQTIEIPDKNKDFDERVRHKLIKEAKAQGLRVISLYRPASSLSPQLIEDLVNQYQQDLDAGADYFSFCNYPGIWLLEAIKDKTSCNHMFFPAESRNNQISLIETFGPQINLSDIQLHDALSVEALRRGIVEKSLEWKVSNES